MKKVLILLFLTSFCHQLYCQSDPMISTYRNNGPFNVIQEINPSSPYLLTYRPDSPSGNFPIVIFQPGANAAFANDINLHTYDLFLKHIVSYGYIVLIVNRTSGGIPDNLFKLALNWAYARKGDSTHWMHTIGDTSRIVVMGHSYGGVNATQLVVSDPSKVDAIIYLASYPYLNPLLGQDVSKYKGKVLSICGSEDSSTTYSEALKGWDAYSASGCKTLVEVKGAGHAAFGNYENATQKVGSIGRDTATATIRYLLVSFLESEIKGSNTASQDFFEYNRRPFTVDTFKTTCDTSNLILSNRNNNTFKTLPVFPNPANDVITFGNTFSYGKAEDVRIFNISGQIMPESTLSDNKIEVGSLAPDTYFIQIKESDTYWLGKFVKN